MVNADTNCFWSAHTLRRDLLSTVLEILSYLLRLRRYERKSVEVGVFRRGWVTLNADFRGKGASPTKHFWYQSSRVIALSCGIKIFAERHLVLSQCTRVTDGQTDRITTPKTALANAHAVIKRLTARRLRATDVDKLIRPMNSCDQKWPSFDAPFLTTGPCYVRDVSWMSGSVRWRPITEGKHHPSSRGRPSLTDNQTLSVSTTSDGRRVPSVCNSPRHPVSNADRSVSPGRAGRPWPVLGPNQILGRQWRRPRQRTCRDSASRDISSVRRTKTRATVAAPEVKCAKQWTQLIFAGTITSVEMVVSR